MHDLYFAKKILDIVLNEAAKNGFKVIKSVKIEIGNVKHSVFNKSKGVKHRVFNNSSENHSKILNLDNIKFNFSLFAKGTIAEDAKLLVKKSKNGILKVIEIEGEQ